MPEPSSASSVNPTIGKRSLKLWVVPVLTLAIILLTVGLLWISSTGKPVRRVLASPDAQGGLAPTLEEQSSGKNPEQQQQAHASTVFRESLGQSAEQKEQHERAVNAAGGPPPAQPPPNGSAAVQLGDKKNSDDERQTRALSMGTALLSDVDKAATAHWSGGAGGTGTDSKSSPYISLYARQMLAAQREAAASGDGKATRTPEKPPEVKMQAYEVPHYSAPRGANGGTGPDATEDVGTPDGRRTVSETLPVNMLPPATVKIPAIFMQNFIAFGAGSDTGQRVVAYVESDVYFRNRLQLPRGTFILGQSGGVRNLDMVDVKFDTIQFPDGTSVSCAAQAYQPYTPEYPEDYGMRGVAGEYEEPPLWSKLAPIILSGIQGYTESNLDRISQRSIQVQSTANTSITAPTTGTDRLYGAANQASSKLVDIVLQSLARYQPRVRVRKGQPVVVILDDYVDLSQRSIMGHRDPMKGPSAAVKSDGGIGSVPDALAQAAGKNNAELSASLSKMSPEMLKGILGNLPSGALEQAGELVNSAPPGATLPVAVGK